MIRTPGSSDQCQIVITGDNFVLTPTVELRNIQAKVKDATNEVITASVPYSMLADIYGLTVINTNGLSGTLSPAFTVYPVPPGPTISLESPYLVTFGTDASPPHDSGFQVQRIFFEVPENLSGDLYVRIFDADTGGLLSVDFMYGTNFNTTTSYTLYGSGTPLLTATIGYSDTLDNRWDSFLGPFSLDKGELVEDRRIFELAVEGQGGDDANWYRVALSTSPDTNTMPSGSRMFACSWTLLVPGTDKPRLHPYVMKGVTTFRLRSLGCDCIEEGRLLIQTPLRELEASCPEKNGSFTPVDFSVEEGEDGMTWTVDFSEYGVPCDVFDPLGFWAEDEISQILPIFTRPTTAMPPYQAGCP